MPPREYIAEGIGGGQRHSGCTDDAGIEQRKREEYRRSFPKILLHAGGYRACIGEIPEFGVASKRLSSERHDRQCTRDHDRDADHEIDALILDETRPDPFVDDIALLKEQLPGRHRGADDGDDQQHHFIQRRPLRHLWHQHVLDHLARRWVDEKEDRKEKKTPQDEGERETLKAAEVAGARREHDERSGRRDAPELRQSEIVERERDADELGDNRQRVENKQIDDAKRAPEFAKALKDEPGMADTGNRAEAQYHFLIDVKNRDQQHQRPEERRAVVLTSLGIGTESA